MEHAEMLEKIWESQEPDKDGIRHAVAYENSDEDGGWRLYFSLEGTVVSQAIVGEGSPSIDEAIEWAYHKIFDVGCWSWDGEHWIDENLHTVLCKRQGRFYDFGTDKSGPLPFRPECLPDLIRLLEADPGLEGPHRKKEITQ